jgi:hypothetical protein
MVLKGRMEVGLRGVARVPGLGEQGEIGQAKARRQHVHLGNVHRTSFAQPGGIEKYANKRQGQQTESGEEQGGWTGTDHEGGGSDAAPEATRVAAR